MLLRFRGVAMVTIGWQSVLCTRGLRPKRPGVIDKPTGAGRHVFIMGTLRRHAGEAQVLEQLGDEPLPVGVYVFLQLLHG